jgi:hypothetical protein
MDSIERRIEMKVKKSCLALMIFLATLVAALLFVSATILAQGKDQPISSAQALTEESAGDVEAYWTEERMKNAKPMPLPELPKVSRTTTIREGMVAPSGPMLIANSGEPGDPPWEEQLSPSGHVVGEEGEVTAEPEPLFGGYPWSYTRYRLFPDVQSKKFPYKCTGKLYFSIPGQGNFVCSASVVNAPNNSLVWTAGHCVYSPGIGFHTNFLFVPGLYGTTQPFGNWKVLPGQVWTLGGWVSGLFNYDHGALVMKRKYIYPIGKRTIGQRVGYLGFVADASRQQHWHLHGYPAAARDLGSTPPGAQFDGKHHEICASTWAANDQPGTAGDPETIGVGCDKTGGTSGGPWVIDFSGVPGATNLLNGNNSYRYEGGPPNSLRLYSPYFTTGAVNLRNDAGNVPVP